MSTDINIREDSPEGKFKKQSKTDKEQFKTLKNYIQKLYSLQQMYLPHVIYYLCRGNGSDSATPQAILSNIIVYIFK